jgi:hypothetical protein
MMRFASLSCFALGTVVLASSPTAAQAPSPGVALSFGVDTSITEVRGIVLLTAEYLKHQGDPTRLLGLWSTQSAFDRRAGDLAQEAYQGFPATILGVTGIGVGDSVFVVKVIHATADSTRQEVTPLALQRFYAVRAPGSPFGWQLSSPLPRITRNWAHRDAGHITFWYEPGQPRSPAKAQRAWKFADSVAKLFGGSPPAHLDAYLTASMENAQRLVGLDFVPENSGPGTGYGGRSGAANILRLGDPRLGEVYLHEIVHAVVGPLVPSRNSIFGEGVAVWLGGSEDKSLKELYLILRDYQRAHPTLSLQELLQGGAPGGNDAVLAVYATRGLIVDSVYRRSGIPGLRRLAAVSGSPAEVIKVLPDYIDGIGDDVSRWWRAETEATRPGDLQSCARVRLA